MEKISIVDITQIGLDISEPTEDGYRSVGKSLDLAFSQIGFVYLIGHGVQTSLVKDVMDVSRDFFHQADDVKDNISRVDQQGWVAQGREIFDQAEDGSIAIHEVREAYDINSLNKEARFPDKSLPKFRKLFQNLGEDEIKLSQRLLICLSLVLNKPREYFNNFHKRILAGENASAVRSLYYPAIKGQLPEGHIRCGEHSDYGTFTLLLQDTYPGLQVKSATGKWVNADPVQGAILVNIGDLLEMWSGGRYPATMHRVIIPEEEILRGAARQSIVFFIHPDDEVMVSPLEGPDAKFPPISALEHVTKRFSATYKY